MTAIKLHVEVRRWFVLLVRVLVAAHRWRLMPSALVYRVTKVCQPYAVKVRAE